MSKNQLNEDKWESMPFTADEIAGEVIKIAESYDHELIRTIRKNFPSKLAEELVSVQPMPESAMREMLDCSMSEEELKAQGYKPVSEIGLMWVKEDE